MYDAHLSNCFVYFPKTTGALLLWWDLEAEFLLRCILDNNDSNQ
jgi:hypothetical protein